MVRIFPVPLYFFPFTTSYVVNYLFARLSSTPLVLFRWSVIGYSAVSFIYLLFNFSHLEGVHLSEQNVRRGIAAVGARTRVHAAVHACNVPGVHALLTNGAQRYIT